MVATAVENLQRTLNHHGASMTIRSASGEATIHPGTPDPDPAKGADPVLERALQRKAEADAALKNVTAGRVGPGMLFCCEAGKKAAVTAAKKHVKQWNDFLATRALLTGYQVEMFDDEFEDEEDEDDAHTESLDPAHQDGWL